MIKRILKFKKHDWQHIWGLVKDMHKQAFIGEFAEAYEAWMWIKVHFRYDSEKKD